MKTVTIKDIAIKSGYSITTVSLALNNSSKVIESTKKKVQDVAINLGYIKNIAAANLRKKEQNIIHIFICDTDLAWGQHKLYNGLITQLQEKNYIISFHIYNFRDIDNKIRLIEAVGGSIIIIFHPITKNLFISQKRIPLINLTYLPKYCSGNYLCLNYNMMVNMLLNIIKSKNHRHICIINNSKNIPISILNTVFKNKVNVDDQIESVTWIESDLYLLDDKIKTLLQNDPQITAFIFTTSESLILAASIFKHLDFIEGISSGGRTNIGKKELFFCNVLQKTKPLPSDTYEICLNYKLFIDEIIRLIILDNNKNNKIVQSLYISPKIIKHKN